MNSRTKSKTSLDSQESEQVFLGQMPKTKENPLGINVLVCPICMKFSFYGLRRGEAVKHFWMCYHDNKK